MNKSIIICGISSFVFSTSVSLHAEESPLLTLPDSDRVEWRSIDEDMSSEEYHQAYRRNQRILYKQLKNLSENALLSIGVPRKGSKYLGAAAGLAVKQDAKLHLNKSKTFALELNDIGEDDRAVIFGISRDW